MGSAYGVGMYVMATVVAAVLLPVFALRLIAWVMGMIGLRR
jgi:hypothetical protein